MPAISFSTMKDKILSDEKKQTIRAKRSDYWLQYEEGDYLVGYWKMRTEGASEQLFESELAEDPFILKPGTWTNQIAEFDGFEWTEDPDPENVITALGNMKKWFKNKYGEDYKDMDFVVIRWE